MNFLVGSVVAGLGGVVFVSCRLGESDVFSEAEEDRQPLDKGSFFFAFLLSASVKFIPLTSLRFGFPPVRLPVCGFAFLFFFIRSASFLACCSFRDNFFGSPVVSSSRDISCCGAFSCSMSKNGKHGYVLPDDFYAT